MAMTKMKLAIGALTSPHLLPIMMSTCPNPGHCSILSSLPRNHGHRIQLNQGPPGQLLRACRPEAEGGQAASPAQAALDPITRGKPTRLPRSTWPNDRAPLAFISIAMSNPMPRSQITKANGQQRQPQQHKAVTLRRRTWPTYSCLGPICTLQRHGQGPSDNTILDPIHPLLWRHLAHGDLFRHHRLSDRKRRHGRYNCERRVGDLLPLSGPAALEGVAAGTLHGRTLAAA